MSDLVPLPIWTSLAISCPKCGNTGRPGDAREKNGEVPFKVVEDVVRSWTFSASREADGKLILVVDTESDDVDWESGTGLRFECMGCFFEFPLPDAHQVIFE